MNRSRQFYVSVAIIFLTMILYGCGEKPVKSWKPSSADSGNGSLVDEKRYVPGDLRTMIPAAVIPMPGIEPWFFTGDVAGDGAHEIICVNKDTLTLLKADGGLIKERRFDGYSFGRGLAADIDSDGKADIVLGFRMDKGIRLAAFSGALDMMFDETFAESVSGVTIPQFSAKEGIYFVSYSANNIAPKAAGIYDYGAGRLVSLLQMGPIPLALSKDSASGLISVSHRAASVEREPLPVSYDIPKERHALFCLDQNLKTVLFKPIGDPAEEGVIRQGTYSRITEKLMDLNDDGSPEILFYGARLSEFYGGPSQFCIMNEKGDILSQADLEPETEGSFGFYKKSKGENRIVIASERTGRIRLLDDSCEVISETVLPGNFHKTVIQRIGDFKGQGNPLFLITDKNHVFILNENLEFEFSTAVHGIIRKAEIFPDKQGKPVMAVLDGELSIFIMDKAQTGTLEVFTLPAGADVALDDTTVDAMELPILHIPAGEHTLTAVLPTLGGRIEAKKTITVEPGALTSVLLDLKASPSEPRPDGKTTPVVETEKIYGDLKLVPLTPPHTPLRAYADFRLVNETAKIEGEVYFLVNNFIGDESLEVLTGSGYENGSIKEITIRDKNLKLKKRIFAPPDSYYIIRDTGDVDGDGRADFVLPSLNPLSFTLINGDGRALLDRPLFYGYDSNNQLKARIENLGVFFIHTGYLLYPRGFYGINLMTGALDFKYPMGLGQNGLGILYHAGLFYASVYTLNNGASVTREDGTIERDDELALNIFDRTGKRMPESQYISGPENAGHLIPFLYDENRDGAYEVFVLEGKSPKYYEGFIRIYKLEKDGTLTTRFTGPRDTNMAPLPIAFTEKEKSKLFIRYQHFDPMTILGADFSFDRNLNLPPEAHKGWSGLHELDGKDGPELFYIKDGDLIISDLFGNILTTVTTEDSDNSVIACYTADMDRDGKTELLVVCAKTIRLYSYD